MTAEKRDDPSRHSSSCPKRRPDLAWRAIDGLVVIVDPQTSMLHDLSEVASFYWVRFDGQRDLEQLVAEAVGEFDVDADSAMADLKDLIETLLGERLLGSDDGPISAD